MFVTCVSRKRTAGKDVRRSRRRKQETDDSELKTTTDTATSDEDNDVEDNNCLQSVDEGMDRLAMCEGGAESAAKAGTSSSAVTTYDDGIFTVTVAAPQSSSSETTEPTCDAWTDCFVPCPRMNPMLCVRHGTLFLYGGIFENGDRQVTLSDFYSLDLHKMDEWKTIIPLDTSSQVDNLTARWYMLCESINSWILAVCH